MKKLEKIFLGALFSILFSVFIFLTTLNFLILNDKFLFYVFEKHNLYEEIPHALAESLPNDPNIPTQEKFAFSFIVGRIPPATIEKIIEGNITNALKFIHGNSGNLIFSLPAKELNLGSSDFSWSLSQNAAPDTKKSINMLHGLGTKLLILWFFVLFALFGLFFLYGKLAKSILGGSRLLITSGSYLFIAGMVLRFIFPAFAKSFPTQLEPSQALLRIFLSSLLPEIGLVWLVIGFIVLTTGVSLFIIERRLRKNQKDITPPFISTPK